MPKPAESCPFLHRQASDHFRLQEIAAALNISVDALVQSADDLEHEGEALLRAFGAIEDENVRRCVLELVRTLAASASAGVDGHSDVDGAKLPIRKPRSARDGRRTHRHTARPIE